MKSRIYLDIHALQVVPPSCINRDDVGAPKTAVYGGVQRSRVSSQSWKRAIREGFRDGLDTDDLSYRTREVIKIVATKLIELSSTLSEEAAEALAKKYLQDVGAITKPKTKAKKGDEDEDEDEDAATEVDGKKTMLFISERQVRAFAEKVLEIESLNEKEKPKDTKLKNILTAVLEVASGVEIDLFGRMVAGNPDLNVDSSVQVAHAISTHEVESEVDYYTAVDDLESVGSGHIGDSEFNSSTLYRYGTINVHDLDSKFTDKERTAKVVRDFIEHFLMSMPTGKVNSFANNTLPSAVYITLREDRPLSFVPAFEKAVPTSEEGYLVKSAEALEDYAQEVYYDYLSEPVESFVLGKYLPKLAGQDGRVRLNTLLAKVEEYIKSVE